MGSLKPKDEFVPFVTTRMSRAYFREFQRTGEVNDVARTNIAEALEQIYNKMLEKVERGILRNDKDPMIAVATSLIDEAGLFGENSLLIRTANPTRNERTLAEALYSFFNIDPREVRVRDTEFGILGTELIWGSHELESLKTHVLHLFTWHTDTNVRDRYAAPYKPVIQSSGTGKTKLLRVFCSNVNVNEQLGIQCFFISCIKRDEVRRDRDNVYDMYLDDVEELDRSLERMLKKATLNSQSGTQILLVLDEAQHLSVGKATGIHALRRFLRKKRANIQVVALIAGTTTCLANCFPSEEARNSSRRGEAISDYHESGKCLFGPIFELYTMGCYGDKVNFDSDATEFDKAVPYGRPLFARLLFDEHTNPSGAVKSNRKLSTEDLCRIATRMLLGTTSPFETFNGLLPFISVWATRVQLGCTQAAVVDELVSKAYAHLTCFSGSAAESINDNGDDGKLPRPTVSFSYVADPVCAYLAMQFMDENWLLEGKDRSFNGHPKTQWVAKLKELLSGGVCQPPRGDLGEVLCATYLLFSGDKVRIKANQHVETGENPTGCKCSIPVDVWVEELQHSRCDSKDTTGSSSKKPGPTINFLQFCRNDLRFAVEDFCSQQFLSHIYKRACAVYAYASCPMIDAVAAAWCGSGHYIPVLMSIKTVAGFTDGQCRRANDTIVKSLFQSKIQAALILVVLLDRGRDDGTKDDSKADDTNVADSRETLVSSTITWQQTATESFYHQVGECAAKIVSRIITIPAEDGYGITNVARSLTGSADAKAVYSSQAFIGSMDMTSLKGTHAVKPLELRTSSVVTLACDTASKRKLYSIWEERTSNSTDSEGNAQQMDVSD